MRPSDIMALGAVALSGLATASSLLPVTKRDLENRGIDANLPRATEEGAASNAADFKVTSYMPRRSEGICKFGIDLVKPEQSAGTGPVIICSAAGQKMLDGVKYSEAALLAARLAVEYDPSCQISESTTYHSASDPKITFKVFDRNDNDEVRSATLGQKGEVFFLDCGAVFLNWPATGPSGTGTSAQVRILRDSRGYLPLMAEFMPKEVFGNDKPSTGYNGQNPPAWLKEALAEVPN
ncbi:hypothetical protein NHJ6243_009792 [Beauveria neobassiana]